jgi:preprotein translocase subunit SecD
VRDTDQLIAGALRDIAAEAGQPGPVADAAWRAGRRRRRAMLAASAASLAGAMALTLAVVLPLTAAPGPASPPPGPLVSITLSPATPASTQNLALAALLLGQRAAQLHLPGTQAQVSGPDVVLTGPAADQTQLQALTLAGALNLRQVLLYQPYNGPGSSASAPVYGDVSLVNHRTLELFRKLACTPDNISAWKDQVGYTSAEDYDKPGTQIVSCDSSGNKYALDVAKVPGTQIGNAAADLSAAGNQWTVLLTFKSAAAAAFTNLTTEQATRYFPGAQAGNQDDRWLDTIAVVLDGNVIAAPQTASPIPSGMAQIAGNFTRAQAEELAADLQSGALPVDFRVSAISTFTPSASSQLAGQERDGRRFRAVKVALETGSLER